MKKRLVLLLLVSLCLLTLTSCRKKLTVNFMVDEKVYLTIEVKKGKKVEEPTIPTKNSFKFIEWQLDGKKYDFDSKVKENLELKAYFKEYQISSDLSSPKNLKLENNKLTWDVVNNVNEYDVYINESVYQTTTNSYDIPNNVQIGFVWVVSKNGTSISLPSETVKYKNEVTKTELEEAYEYLGSGYPNADEIILLFKQIGLSLSELNCFDNCKSEMDVINVIYDKFLGENAVITKEGLSKFVSYYLISFYEETANSLLNKESYYPITEEEYNIQLQEIFDTMKANNGYSSSFENVFDDKRFVNLIVPYLTSYCRYYIDSYNTIIEVGRDAVDLLLTYNEYSKFFEITRKDLNVTFKNVITDEEYGMSFAEIEQFITYLKNEDRSVSVDILSKSDLISMYHFRKLEDEYIKKVANSFNDKYSLTLYIEKNLNTAIDTTKDLIDVYKTIFTTLTNTDNNIFTNLSLATNFDEFKKALEQILDFKNQVIDMLLDKMPTKEETDSLVDFFEVFKIVDMISLGFRTQINIQDIKTIINDATNLVKTTLSFVRNIDINSYDLNELYNLLYNSSASFEESFMEIIKLSDDFEQYLGSNISYNKLHLDSVLNLVLTPNDKNLCNFFLEDLDNNVINKFISLFERVNNNANEKLSKENLMIYIELIQDNATPTFEIIINKLIPDLLRCIDKNELNKLKGEIINVIELAIYQYDISLENHGSAISNAETLYNLIYDNYDLLVEYFEIGGWFGLVTGYNYTIDDAMEVYEKAKAYYLNETKRSQLVNLCLEFAKIFYNESGFIEVVEILNSDLKAKFEQVRSLIGKSYSELTQEERNLIYEFEIIGISFNVY